MAEARSDAAQIPGRDVEVLRAENLRLKNENERWRAQAAGAADANARAAAAIAALEGVQSELRKRERILDAITRIAATLLRAPCLDAALPAALAETGQAIGADRVVLLELLSGREGRRFLQDRGVWNAPGVEPRLPDFLAAHRELMPAPEAFFAALGEDEIQTVFPRQREDDFGRFLRMLNVRSVLFVPVRIEAELGGYLIFDDCHSERVWTAAECGALGVLAQIVRAAVVRQRDTLELSEAKRIVENSSAVLYRAAAGPDLPTTYISANVSRWGYRPAQFTAAPRFYQSLIHPEDLVKVRARIERRLQGRPEPAQLEVRVRTADGSYRWFENHIAPVRDESGRLAGFEGMLIDIDERKRAAEEVRKRERILDAITKVAAELLATAELDAALARTLPLAGEAIGADRVIVLETRVAADGTASIKERGVWNAFGVEPHIQPGFLESRPELAAIPEAFFASLSKGELLTALPRGLRGPFGDFLRSLNIQSFLLVPVLVEGERWGFLAFDDCRAERVWSSAECGALQVLAEIIGASLWRERHLAEMSEAKRIVENSTTILYRATAEPPLPLTYVSANVSKWGYDAARFLAEPDFYRQLVCPEDQAGMEAMVQALLRGQAVGPLEFRMRLPDGSYRWFENRATILRDQAGRPREFEGVLFDIQERKLSAEEVRKRDRMLDAITRIAADLMAAQSLDEIVPELLHTAGEAVEAERVMVLENTLSADHGDLVRERYAWHAPGLEPQSSPGFLGSRPETAALLRALFSRLPKGQILTASPRELEGDAGSFLRRLCIQSIVLAPIFVDGEAWGYLGIGDCRKERSWSKAERDALQVLAEILGASVARARRMAKLAEAQRIVENSTTVLFRHKAQPGLPVIYVSANVSRWGYRPEQFTAAPGFHLTLVHPDDQGRLAAWIEELLQGSGADSAEFRLRFSDGSYHWFDNRTALIRDQSGRVVEIEGALSDIDERKQAEQRLSFANAVMSTSMENLPNGFLVVDPIGRVLAFNQRFLEMWKVPPEVAAARMDEALLKAVAQSLQDPESFLKRIRYLYEHPEEKVHDELAFRDGRMFERHSAALYDAEQRYLGRIWFFFDVTARKQSERELARLARTDVLTGLANRATFLERLELMFAASRRGASPFAVLYVDLDNFKDVNDALGHAAGDELLKEMALRVAANVRSTDLVARFGGDEFAVLQADADDPSTCGALASKIHARLAEPYQLKGSELRMSSTIGIALYSPEIEQPAEVLARADRALYRGKEEGRDRYCFHSADLDVQVHERITLSEELRRAIEQDQLELHYQPQVDIGTGRIVGVEALVRWNHPRRGQLKPAAFLPTAERTGVIGPLGDWVLDRACRQLRRWRDEDLAAPVMAVNLSAAQLKLGRDFDRKVAAALAKWGLASQDLEFDVTESVLAGSAAMQPDALERLRDLGVRIAIDDFGSDYTSIGRVKAYQVKRFKIAPQFIKGMTTDPVNAGVVRMMINVARQLGIEIIAKSVETEEQRNFLRSVAEAVQAQGYYYSEPLDARQATELLRRKGAEHPLAGPAMGRR